MTSPHPQPSSAFADFATALGGEIEAELLAQPPVPDLADVFARARQLDESAIPDGLHGNLELPGHPEADEADDEADAGLALFAAALRGDVEADADAREIAPIPAAAPRGLRWGYGLAVAAMVLLGLGSLPRLIPWIAERGAQQDPIVGSHSEESRDEGQHATPRAPSSSSPRVHTVQPLPSLASTTGGEVGSETGSATEGDTEAESSARRRQKRSTDELENQARAAWAAGDLATAESLLRKVVVRAGRSTRAELAYGDLFAIARQRRGEAAQAKVWGEYLRRFPHGRYADDVRGGLCRRTTGDQSVSCWGSYLATYPNGAHAAEGRRRLAQEPPP